MGLGAVVIGIIVLVVIVGFIGVGIYNKLVTSKEVVDSSLSNIDVNLKRRADLIPALVKTVKGYASHEKETFESVVKARQQVVQLPKDATVKQVEEANNALEGSLGRLMAISERYPDLKADKNFMQMQEELTSTENKIAHARTYYNKAVMSFNRQIKSFPSNLIANNYGFVEENYIEIAETERDMPDFDF